MPTELTSIGSIATHIHELFPSMSSSLSGALLPIVDMNRAHVASFTGRTVPDDNISKEFQPPIVNLSKADLIELISSQEGGERLKLGELSTEEVGEQASAQSYRDIANSMLRAIGKNYQIVKSLS